MLVKISATFIGLTVRIHPNGSLVFEQRGDNLDGSVLPQQFEVGEQVRLNQKTEPTATVRSSYVDMTEQPGIVGKPYIVVHKRFYEVELLAVPGHVINVSEETLLDGNARPCFRFEFDEKPVQVEPVASPG